MKRISILIFRGNCSSMGSLFSYFNGSLQDFLTHIKETNENSLIKVRLASVSSGALTELSSAGVDNRFYHVLDNFAVNHIITKHTNEKEVLRGQAILQESDFLLIPHIVSNYDSIQIENVKNKTTVLYSKECYDSIYYYIEEIRKGRHELAGVTFYKRKKKLTDAESPADSADSGFASFSKKTHRRKELNSAISGFAFFLQR